jgi:erythromycin esterase
MKRLVPLLSIVALLATMPAAAQRLRVSGRAPTPATWLRTHAFATDDLRPLVALVGDARVVALGDVTHGTHELFAFKQRIMPLLAEEGFDAIAFEAPYAEWESIDDAVHGDANADVAAALAQNDYFFWDTDETVALLEWVREHPQMTVAGIDCAHPFPAIDRLLAQLQTIDPALAADVASRYDCFLQWRTRPGAYTGRFCREDVASVRTLLASQRVRFASDDAFENALHAARVIEQGEEALGTAFVNRDAAMAENIEWLLARGHRVIVAGHDEHFGRTPYALGTQTETVGAGALLSRHLSNRYFVLGSIAGGGTFNAYQYFDARAFLAVHTMQAPAADDVATRLREAGMPAMIVPLRSIAPAWLDAVHTVRIAGTNIVTPARPMLELRENVAEKFDAILFLDDTTPTHLRHSPTLP